MAIPSVLIVESDAALRQFCAKALRQRGYAVQVAATLDEARAALRDRAFDAVLCNFYVGYESGLQLLRENYLRLITNETQVIVMADQPKVKYICADLGFEFFQTMPFCFDNLLALLQRGLGDGTDALALAGD